MSSDMDIRRLLISFEQSCTEEDRELYFDNSSDDEDSETDNISDQNRHSDTEQDLSSSEEDETLPNTDPLEETYTGKDGVTKWSSQYYWTDTIKSEKIAIDTIGVQPVARDAKTEIDCWKLFITDGMMEQILRHTNAAIKKKMSSTKEHTRYNIWKETTKEELLALFGLIYISGLYSSSRQSLNDFWSNDGTGVEIFRTTMPLHRFYFLQNCLRFDDEATRMERKKLDNLAPIRTIYEQLVSNCQNNYSPSEYLTIDTYFPNKPNYGIKMYALVDAKSFYTVNLEIYAAEQPDGPYSQSDEPFHVVDRLVKPISKTNRNVTFDKKFTSVKLALHLLHNHNLTFIGTISKNEMEIPTCFVNYRKHAEDIPMFAFQKDLTLVSYRPNKSKVVLVLSSLHHDQRVGPTTRGNKLKPEVLTSYDSTKSGVDVVGKLCSMYNVARNSKYWTTTVFYTIMNIAAINSIIIYRENNKSNANRRDFIKKLGLSMIEGHLFTRKNKDSLPRGLRKRIHDQIGENIPLEKPEIKYRRCKDCPTARDRKTKHTCSICNKPICMPHIVNVCKNCIDRNSD